MKISIVLPERNQADKLLRHLKESILPYFDAQPVTYEVIISPNGCNEEDIAFLEKAKESLPLQVKVLPNGPGGKGNGVKYGILASDGDYVGFMDADLATDLRVFEQILPDLGKIDCFIASRDAKGAVYAQKQPLKRRITHFGSRMVIAMKFHLGVKDTQCGYKFFRTSIAKKMVEKQIVTAFAFDVEYLWFLRMNGFSIKEVPCIWTDDPNSTIASSRKVSEAFAKDLNRIKKNKQNYLLTKEEFAALKEDSHVD